MKTADWIAAEISTTGIRIWAMDGAEPVTSQNYSDIPDAMRNIPDLPILIADMTGRPDPDAPKLPAPAGLRMRPAQLEGRDVQIVQGASYETDSMMISGQCAVIAGIMAASPDFDGVICLPGHDSYWARISAGEICHFHAYPTGDLFMHLSGKYPEKTEENRFREDFEYALSRPHRAYGRLFGLRNVAEGADGIAAALIGIEMADAKPYWLGEKVVVAGTYPLADCYINAMKYQGVNAIPSNNDSALLAGLHSGWKSLRQ